MPVVGFGKASLRYVFASAVLADFRTTKDAEAVKEGHNLSLNSTANPNIDMTGSIPNGGK